MCFLINIIKVRFEILLIKYHLFKNYFYYLLEFSILLTNKDYIDFYIYDVNGFANFNERQTINYFK